MKLLDMAKVEIVRLWVWMEENILVKIEKDKL
jgi:hypothetical protein